AWSEAWANFFASAALHDPVFRDSRGPGGTTVLRYDLEENVPADDRPGYRSEASVDSLLWDLFDDSSDEGDSVAFPFAEIWSAFPDLRNHHFVYLPFFLEHFLAKEPEASDAVRTMAQLRSIDFQPNVRPSITNPFPSTVELGAAVTGF